MNDREQTTSAPLQHPTRRAVMLGTGGVIGVATLAACGGSGKTGATAVTTRAASPSSAAAATPTSAGNGQPLLDLAVVPVGGAASATTKDGKPVIVAQPTAGHVVAFSAVCTHMGCTVAPKDKILQCPCHGSQYDLADGSVIHGPAPRALEQLQVKVDDGQVVLDA